MYIFVCMCAICLCVCVIKVRWECVHVCGHGEVAKEGSRQGGKKNKYGDQI